MKLPNAARSAIRHAEAAAFFTRMADDTPAGRFAQRVAPPVRQRLESLSVAPNAAPILVRHYEARRRAPVVMLIPGMHADGIDEARLCALATNFCQMGLHVVTPEIKELAEFGLWGRGIDMLGLTARHLKELLGVARVGFIGVSFGASLGLVAASRPEFASSFGLVLTLGAYYDLYPVCRWYLGEEVVGRHGKAPVAHRYGVQILSHMATYFFCSEEDKPLAEEALRLAITDHDEEALEVAQGLQGAEAKRLVTLMITDYRKAQKEPVLREALEDQVDRLAEISPKTWLEHLQCPLFCLHGTTDDIILAVETERMEDFAPKDKLRAAVVSPFIGHANTDDGAHWAERVKLLRVIADVLGVARRTCV